MFEIILAVIITVVAFILRWKAGMWLLEKQLKQKAKHDANS